MDPIKESFDKVKQDINSLREDLFSLREGLVETREQMVEICEILRKLHKQQASTHKPQIQTYPKRSQTDNTHFKALNSQNIPISTGNEGASTDRQTDRQTNRHTQNTLEIPKNSVDDAVAILNSLDNIKKEIRLKFKRLTDQEMLIFSTMYQLDEENGYSDYKTLSEKLKLSESSIRDYIGRLIKKGVPVEKNKINNKMVQLKISNNLKKIVSLPTIMKLRDL